MFGEELINPIIKSRIYGNNNNKIESLCLFKSECIGVLGTISTSIGSGISLNFHIPNATRTSDYNKNNTEGGIIELVARNVTNGSESFDWRFKAKNSGTLNTVLILGSSGDIITPKGPAIFSSLTGINFNGGLISVNTHSIQKGKYINIASHALIVMLPPVVVGASFIIVNINADGGGLLTISPNSNDKFLVDIAGADGTDDTDIENTKATQKQYDYVKIIGLNSDGWLISDIRGIWVDEGEEGGGGGGGEEEESEEEEPPSLP